jgi:uncharacterized membrane protein
MNPGICSERDYAGKSTSLLDFAVQNARIRAPCPLLISVMRHATVRPKRCMIGLRQISAKELHRVALFRGAETHTRSVLKAISWRTLGTLDTFAISWFLTGKIAMAGSIAGLELVTKIAWYYLHERVWAAISWGRR